MKDKAAEFITPEEQAKHKRAVGTDGEAAACELLGKKGYEITARNYRAGRGEIDIIARSSRHIVFVEVKTRTAGTLIQGALRSTAANGAASLPAQGSILTHISSTSTRALT